MVCNSIFDRIIKHEAPADIVYQDEHVTAFRDILPKAPIHILIVTNILISTVNDVSADHELILGRMFIVASKLARENGINDTGYRLVVNCNDHAGQEIYHLHMHLLGGKYLGPMLV